jgi:hypothetical protein
LLTFLRLQCVLGGRGRNEVTRLGLLAIGLGVGWRLPKRN